MTAGEWGTRPMRTTALRDDDGWVTDEASSSTADQTARLIELGRDRDAAVLGALGDQQVPYPARPKGSSMDPLAQLDQLGPVLEDVVSHIRPDQLDNPTPCANFTVRGVLEHMIGGATMFAAGFRGEPAAEPNTTDPLAAIGPALENLVTAMHQPGALDRTIEAPFGEVPGEAFARYVVLDGLVHSWDLATATGQTVSPPDALVAEVDAYAHQTLDALRDGDAFAAAVEPPATATPIERLAAYTGRQV